MAVLQHKAEVHPAAQAERAAARPKAIAEGQTAAKQFKAGPRTQYTAAGGKRHIKWATRINNKKVKRVVRISDELGTLQGALQQTQQATESDATSDTLQASRIMGLKVQIAEHEQFFAGEAAAVTTSRLADVVQDVAQPLAGQERQQLPPPPDWLTWCRT